ncbi:uroporphyrinogen decarboxylase [Caulobacter sp. NIBR1757]|uniref:uroporphyrinogen decarboxylase n=1 Tax=Caulobacter sp. NIBR1757 TaxID=3016000 RepID=UPI0022F05CB1|nr:uroporphyrinogen decarboxylase [Caulobacter sp. NIBR1757]WGM37183.1 Uroporphyrinogen decarboxylase [Caulobacter sp. NIBR1757]
MTPAPLSPLLRVLAGETLERPPVWFMRQAGRYLPEYRAVRATAPDFIAFCHDPEKASEVTLQPLRRFPFDAAIVFADILLIPGALGQKVWFEAGEGPRLGELPSLDSMAGEIEASTDRLSAIGQTLSLVRAQLPADKTLIGFAGAPWTVGSYMIEGGSSDRSKARTFAYEQPQAMDRLMDILAEATARYLAMQEEAGAQVLKIFESWSEGLPEDLFHRLVIRPHQIILKRLKELGVTAPVIGFPRGSAAYAETYATEVDVQCVALDTAAPAALGQSLQKRVAIQGALDPLLLRAGGPELDRRVDQLLRQWGDGRYIFNLGHGILPDTPIAHVERVLQMVTGK